MEICGIIFLSYLFLVIATFTSGTYRKLIRFNLGSLALSFFHIIGLGLFLIFIISDPPWVNVYGGSSAYESPE